MIESARLRPSTDTDEPRPCGRRTKLRILLLGIEPRNETGIALLLRSDEHDFHVASSGPDALEIHTRERPDVELLAVDRADIDSWQVARSLKEQAMKKRPLLIAVNGSVREDDQRRSEEAGIHLHLGTAVCPERLRAFLNRFHSFLDDNE